MAVAGGDGPLGELAAAGAELDCDPLAVGLHRVLREAELLGDLAVLETGADARKDLHLASRQRLAAEVSRQPRTPLGEPLTHDQVECLLQRAKAVDAANHGPQLGSEPRV